MTEQNGRCWHWLAGLFTGTKCACFDQINWQHDSRREDTPALGSQTQCRLGMRREQCCCRMMHQLDANHLPRDWCGVELRGSGDSFRTFCSACNGGKVRSSSGSGRLAGQLDRALSSVATEFGHRCARNDENTGGGKVK